MNTHLPCALGLNCISLLTRCVYLSRSRNFCLFAVYLRSTISSLSFFSAIASFLALCTESVDSRSLPLNSSALSTSLMYKIQENWDIPFCYCCKKIGHRSSVCPNKRGLRVCEFGLPGQGFYSIHIPTDTTERKKDNAGNHENWLWLCRCVNHEGRAGSFIQRGAEMEHQKDECRKWIHDHFFQWRIRHQVAKFESFDFETSSVKAKVIRTEISAAADGNLVVVWVKAYNLPLRARTVDTVMEVAYIVGDPEEVDLNCLKKPGPVRIELACRNAREI